MLKPRSLLLVATVVVTNLIAAALIVYAETPTEANFTACNTDAPAAMKAGIVTPTTKDHKRVEAARKGSAAIPHSTDSTGSSDPQLVGMAPEGITDAAYQAAYRTCMRRSGF
jgi:hypothetical protein